MTKYATNNPLGSMDPKDLFDNSQNLDYALNDITRAIWTDRFGRTRKTIWGAEQAFLAQLMDQKQRFDLFIQNSGYEVIGEYTSGPLTFTEYNQLIRYQNELYKLTAATAIPFTTTGNDAASWTNDSTHFVSVGDAALRQELAAPGGSKSVNFTPYGLSASVNVEDQLRGASNLIPGRLGFFKDTGGANIHRLRDRVLIGDAARYAANRLGTSGYGDSWITKYAANWLLKNSVFASSNDDVNAGIGVLGASRTAPGVTPDLTNCGVAGLTLNEGTNTFGRAMYAEAMHKSPNGSSVGIEIQVGNYTSRVPVANAYDMSGVVVSGLYLGVESGVGYTVGDNDTPTTTASNPAGSAIDIAGGSLGAAFQKWIAGIVFRDGGLLRDSNGFAKAMSLARNHTISWEINGNNTGAKIWSEVADPTQPVGLRFTNRRVQMLGVGNRVILDTLDDTAGAGAVNYPVVKNSRTGVNVAVGTTGSDANAGMDVYSQGSGSLRLMSHGGSADNLRILPPATAPVNYMTASGAVSGNPVLIGAAGTDTDISLRLNPKGAGQIIVGNTLRPNSDNAFDYGSASFRGRTAYFGTGAINTSDEIHKPVREEIPDEVLDAWQDVSWRTRYKFDDAIEAKGADGARWHFGLIAQRVRDVFSAHGIDGFQLGLLCHDEWPEHSEKVQINDGVVVTRTRQAQRIIAVTKTRIVSQPVVITEMREVLVDAELEDGTRIKKVVQKEYSVIKTNKVPVFNEDGSPYLENGVQLLIDEPVTEDIEEEYQDTEVEEFTEEYTEPEEPEYEYIVTPAGSRYGIRYEEALSLEAALQRRNYERLLAEQADLAARVEALESK